MTEVEGTLDEWVSSLAEMTDADLRSFITLLERTYIHAMIEAGLRGAPR